MKRTAVAWMMLAAVGGCASTGGGQYQGESAMSQANNANPMSCASMSQPRPVPGVMGPWGQPVAMAMPYAATPDASSGETAAKVMLAQSMPLDLVQRASYRPGRDGSGIIQAQATVPMPPQAGLTPPGAPPMPGVPGMPGMPQGGMPQGGMPMGGMPMGGMPMGMPMGGPGMAGPGGMAGIAVPPGMNGQGMGGIPGVPPGAVAAIGAIGTGPMGGGPGGPGGPGGAPYSVGRTSVRFVNPAGMKVSWYAPTPDGKRAFSPTPLEVPGRYNFVQGAIYRLKLSDIPEFPQMDLYPSLEVVPGNAKTSVFLAHSSVPVSFSADDLRMVAAGNYLVKVIYLPDCHCQDVAVSGTDELVSTQLEPGVDPIAEACKRGSILLVVRLGNIDLEAKHTPPMDAPPPGYCPPGMMVPPGLAARPGAMPPGMAPNGTAQNPPPGIMPPVLPGLPGLPGGVPTSAPADQKAPAGTPGTGFTPLAPPGLGPTGRLPDLGALPVSASGRAPAAPLTPAQLAGQPAR